MGQASDAISAASRVEGSASEEMSGSCGARKPKRKRNETDRREQTTRRVERERGSLSRPPTEFGGKGRRAEKRGGKNHLLEVCGFFPLILVFWVLRPSLFPPTEKGDRERRTRFSIVVVVVDWVVGWGFAGGGYSANCLFL